MDVGHDKFVITRISVHDFIIYIFMYVHAHILQKAMPVGDKGHVYLEENKI